MINISNCPLTGLQRKLTYDFYWLSSAKQIVINCTVQHFNEGEKIETAGIRKFQKSLTASDTLVDKRDGHFLSKEEIDNDKKSQEPFTSFDENNNMIMVTPDYDSIAITEYDFYVTVIGKTPIILPQLIESIIAQRDTEGKFNI